MMDEHGNQQQTPEGSERELSGQELIARVVEREHAADPAAKREREEAYNAYVKQVTPAYSLPLHMVKAFFTGGAICLIGQIITSYCTDMRGMDPLTAGKWTSLILVLASAVLTGLNIYPSLAQFAGAGVLVPITGFANAVASPALEFRAEGMITGLAAKLFIIAGPVIVYGTLASVVYGLILCLAT